MGTGGVRNAGDEGNGEETRSEGTMDSRLGTGGRAFQISEPPFASHHHRGLPFSLSLPISYSFRPFLSLCLCVCVLSLSFSLSPSL